MDGLGWLREGINFPTPQPQTNTIIVPGRNSHRRELKKKSIVKMPKIQAFKGIKNKIKSLITTLFLA